MPTPATSSRARKWPLAVGLAAILSGLSWFLISEGLDRADKWASIGSLIVGVVSLLLYGTTTRSAREQPGDDRWLPEDDGVVSAIAEPDDLPAWPAEYPGYRRSTPKPTFDHSAPLDQQPKPDAEWTTESVTVRVFAGQGLSIIDGFPATMNGARHQRFLIRWRTLDGSDVAMTLISMPDRIDFGPRVFGPAECVRFTLSDRA